MLKLSPSIMFLDTWRLAVGKKGGLLSEELSGIVRCWEEMDGLACLLIVVY